MKKLLILGASGFLGQNLCQQFKNHYETVGTFHNNPIAVEGIEMMQLDLNDDKALRECISALHPAIIVNTAAASDPNQVEQTKEDSYLVNVTLNEKLATICAEKGIQFLTISTDLVFDGTNALYQESDDEKAICEYGIQKRKMENKVLALNADACIIRIPPIYGKAYGNSSCFLTGVLSRLKSGEPLHLFTDEYRSFEFVGNIGTAIGILLKKNHTGLYHVAGKENLSRMEIGQIICEVFGFDKQLLKPSKQKDVQMPAKRPANVGLDISKIQALGYNTEDTFTKLTKLKEAYDKL